MPGSGRKLCPERRGRRPLRPCAAAAVASTRRHRQRTCRSSCMTLPTSWRSGGGTLSLNNVTRSVTATPSRRASSASENPFAVMWHCSSGAMPTAGASGPAMCNTGGVVGAVVDGDGRGRCDGSAAGHSVGGSGTAGLAGAGTSSSRRTGKTTDVATSASHRRFNASIPAFSIALCAGTLPPRASDAIGGNGDTSRLRQPGRDRR
jgi:hypothetical protein